MKTEKTRFVFIPKTSKNDTERFIGVNGENLLVQTGRRVELPERFALVFEAQAKQDAAAEEYIAAHSREI